MEPIRQINLYRDCFLVFYEGLAPRVQEKIEFVLEVLRTQKQVPQEYVKHLTNSNGIFEIRVAVRGNQYRVLFFFKEGDLISGGDEIVVLNGFLKKSKKDYPPAIKKAELLKIQYLEENK